MFKNFKLNTEFVDKLKEITKVDANWQARIYENSIETFVVENTFGDFPDIVFGSNVDLDLRKVWLGESKTKTKFTINKGSMGPFTPDSKATVESMRLCVAIIDNWQAVNDLVIEYTNKLKEELSK